MRWSENGWAALQATGKAEGFAGDFSHGTGKVSPVLDHKNGCMTLRWRVWHTLTELLRASLALPPQSVWTSTSRLLHQSLDLWCFWGRLKIQNKQTNRTDKLKKKIKTTSFCKIITIIKKICYDTTNLQAWSRKFPCNSFPSVKWKTTLIWTCLPLWAMKERKEIDFNIWHRI